MRKPVKTSKRVKLSQRNLSENRYKVNDTVKDQSYFHWCYSSRSRSSSRKVLDLWEITSEAIFALWQKMGAVVAVGLKHDILLVHWILLQLLALTQQKHLLLSVSSVSVQVSNVLRAVYKHLCILDASNIWKWAAPLECALQWLHCIRWQPAEMLPCYAEK